MTATLSPPTVRAGRLAAHAARLVLAAMLALSAPASVLAQDNGFSFVAYGDSRSMMYLPYDKSEEDKIHSVIVGLFALLLGEKLGEEIVKEHVKLTYDDTSGALSKIEMPLFTKSEVARLYLENGWVITATVEDTKLDPDVEFVMYRNYGGDWVGEQVAREVVDGGAKFIVNSGDVVWWGGQGRTIEDSPYWKRMNDLLFSKLPAPDDELLAAGLEGRYFPAVGNHEVWDDPKIEGVLSAAPYLAKLGVSSERLIYTFDFNDTRFIYLWTGRADRFAPSGWDATRPVYKDQLEQLKTWLDEAKAAEIANVFVVFHNPVYNRSGFAPIPADTNPHETLASYADDFAELIVFNGHVHTTETFDVDGVKYIVMGGGGAEQDPILPGRTAIPRPHGYPEDLYWRGQKPKEEYNYLVVEVMPGQKSVQGSPLESRGLRNPQSMGRGFGARPYQSRLRGTRDDQRGVCLLEGKAGFVRST